MTYDRRLLEDFAFAPPGLQPVDLSIAASLCAALETEPVEAGVRVTRCYGPTVEIEFVNGELWAIECLGPEAFHFYPGIVQKGGVTWLSIWVAADYSLEKLVGEINEVAAAARLNDTNPRPH